MIGWVYDLASSNLAPGVLSLDRPPAEPPDRCSDPGARESARKVICKPLDKDMEGWGCKKQPSHSLWE